MRRQGARGRGRDQRRLRRQRRAAACRHGSCHGQPTRLTPRPRPPTHTRTRPSRPRTLARSLAPPLRSSAASSTGTLAPSITCAVQGTAVRPHGEQPCSRTGAEQRDAQRLSRPKAKPVVGSSVGQSLLRAGHNLPPPHGDHPSAQQPGLCTHTHTHHPSVTFSSSAMSPLGVSTARLKNTTPPMADTPCKGRRHDTESHRGGWGAGRLAAAAARNERQYQGGCSPWLPAATVAPHLQIHTLLAALLELQAAGAGRDRSSRRRRERRWQAGTVGVARQPGLRRNAASCGCSAGSCQLPRSAAAGHAVWLMAEQGGIG